MIPPQKSLLDEVLKKDSYMVIILDACRYDMFAKVYREYLTGELLKVKSPASTTPHWVKRTFTGYYDAVYVSANPFILPKLSRNAIRWLGSYTPKDHFRRIVPVILTDWDDNLRTVHPKSVVRRALENLYPRMIIHLLQPHGPYIGRRRIVRGGPEIVEMMRRGEVTLQEVFEAYMDNIRIALEHVTDLISRVDHENIVITSDHGEIISRERIEHPPDMDTPELREVPYLTIRRTAH